MSGRIATALKGYFNRETPGYMIFFVTPFCACRCKMCFNMDAILNAGNRNVLSFEEIEKIAKNWQGLHQINFSGGDPMLRPDFAEIVKLFYDHSGTRFFTIPSSSSHPDKFEKQVSKVCEYAPEAWIRITQSIDGVGELHNEIRQRKGLFDCVVDFNDRLDKLTRKYDNLSVAIATVFCKFNRGHNYELLDYAYENLKITDLGSLFVRGETPESDAKDVEGEEFVKFQKECIRRRREKDGKPVGLSSRAFAAVNHTVAEFVMEQVSEPKYVMPCQAGRRMVVMSDEGEIEPCEMLGYMINEGLIDIPTSKFGNIRDFDYDIKAVVNNDTAREVNKQIVEKKCHCTFECAMAVNTIYNPQAWPRVAKNFVSLKG